MSLTTRPATRLAFACAALILVPATAAGKTLVGTPGKDRLRGGDNGNVINGDGGGDKSCTAAPARTACSASGAATTSSATAATTTSRALGRRHARTAPTATTTCSAASAATA